MSKYQLLVSVMFLFATSITQASETFSITPCSSSKNGEIDFSDAPTSYGVACHQTPRWQKLGEDWDTDNVDQAVDGDTQTDDGVAWSIWSEENQEWGDYSNTNVITEGDNVRFEFKFNRISAGNHYYDNLKVWFDQDLDASYTDDDIITDIKWHKEQDSNIVGDYDDQTHSTYSNSKLDATQNKNSLITSLVYYEELTIPTDMNIPLGLESTETWLRARVVCSNSLSKYADNMVMDATGYQDQGEVEDYKITIAKRTSTPPPSEVPEPSSIALFSIALLFMSRRRFLKR